MYVVSVTRGDRLGLLCQAIDVGINAYYFYLLLTFKLVALSDVTWIIYNRQILVYRKEFHLSLS